MKKNTKLFMAIGFCLVGIVLNESPAGPALKMPGKLIIDTDAGADDAGAILLALRTRIEGFEVIAITCVYGNTNVTNVETNVLKTLTIGNRSDIPVYSGASRSLLRNFTDGKYFGDDGFGDFDFGKQIIGTVDRSKHASVALVDLARLHAGNVSVMALGPLTNIALAVTLDPNFVYNVERFYIVGGSVHGIGNVAPNVEANFQHDAHSNYITLNSTRGPTAILFPWEATLTAAITMEWRRDVLGAINSTTMKFLNQAERKVPHTTLWTPADIILCALALRPELITRTRVTNVTPVFDGAAEGSVLVDYDNLTGRPPNVEIIEAFDVEGFKDALINAYGV